MGEANQDVCIFGDVPLSFETLFTTITSTFRANMGTADLRPPRSKTGWYTKLTTSLRSGLAAIAGQFGAELCSYELLVDHTCLMKNWSGVLLASESEWRRSDFDIRQDFQKLLAIKSPVKVFACLGPCDAVRVCTEALAAFQQNVRGEKYLLVELGPTSARGFGWKATEHGPCPTAKFEEVAGSPMLWSSFL